MNVGDLRTLTASVSAKVPVKIRTEYGAVLDVNLREGVELGENGLPTRVIILEVE